MNVFWIIYFSKKKKIGFHTSGSFSDVSLFTSDRAMSHSEAATATGSNDKWHFLQGAQENNSGVIGKNKNSSHLVLRHKHKPVSYPRHTEIISAICLHNGHTELLNRLRFTPQHHALVCADLNTPDGAKVPWRMRTRHFISLLSDVSNQFNGKTALEGNPCEPLVTCP